MKRIALISIFIFVFCSSILPQKLTEPTLLGNWTAGEEPSEFLLHRVMETSQRYLEDNPEGKLIVRICSLDNFSTSFIKAPLNPLSASNYNKYRLLVPYEKIFIANSAKRFEEREFIFNEYWFVPNENTLEYDKIIPVNDISYKSFVVDDYDSDSRKDKAVEEQKKEFAENITEFINELKSNEESEGFIVYYSNTKKIKRNIEKVMALLTKENVSLQRIKTAIRTNLVENKKGKWVQIKDKKETFPSLEILTIKQ